MVAAGKGTELPLTGAAPSPLYTVLKQMAQYILAEMGGNVVL